MKWGRINDPDREAYMCDETGWVVFQSVIDGYWLVFSNLDMDKHYGPYEDAAEAQLWAERLQELTERIVEEDGKALPH